MNEQDFQALSAGYALNALSPSDRRDFDDALAAHPEWIEHVRVDVDTTTILADAVDPVAPPRAMRADLLARIAATPQTPAGSEAPSIPDDASGITAAAPRRGRRTWFVLAASLALVAALGVGGSVIWQQAQPPAAVVALEQIQQASDAQSAEFSSGSLDATAHWSAETGQAVLVSDGLPTLATDETFELWFVRDGAPVSAGTFSASAGDATALLEGEMHAGDVIAVTVEPSGGSPTGAPTGEPIVAIET